VSLLRLQEIRRDIDRAGRCRCREFAVGGLLTGLTVIVAVSLAVLKAANPPILLAVEISAVPAVREDITATVSHGVKARRIGTARNIAAVGDSVVSVVARVGKARQSTYLGSSKFVVAEICACPKKFRPNTY
jgi:hypothetical protein